MAPAIHIVNGALIDGTGSDPVPATDVVLSGDSIVAVGPTGTLADRVPDGATVIDATGASILPGLIDAHCHVTFDDVQ
jgi:imidazolonepropionase-like amidohydrolase